VHLRAGLDGVGLGLRSALSVGLAGVEGAADAADATGDDDGDGVDRTATLAELDPHAATTSTTARSQGFMAG
jgi:hypothetical protein